MNEPHTVTETELSDYVEAKRKEWERFAGSHGLGSDKRLEFQIGSVAPLYRVTDHGREIYVGALKETAIREYNALP